MTVKPSYDEAIERVRAAAKEFVDAVAALPDGLDEPAKRLAHPPKGGKP